MLKAIQILRVTAVGVSALVVVVFGSAIVIWGTDSLANLAWW